MRKLGLAIILLLVTAGGAAASPARVCAATGDDTIELDGMLDDWDDVQRFRAGAGSADASFDLRCLYDGKNLYVSVDVRDEHVVRNGKAPAGEDRLELTLGAGKAPLVISLYPGKDKVAPRRQVGGKPAPGWLGVEDTLQQDGWSVEVRVPLAKVAGWGPSVPAVSASARYQDADVPKLAMAENTVEWDATLTLGNADALHAQVLAELKLTPAQITLDATADLDPTRPGPERVIAGGTSVALLTDVYGYVQLPVSRAADVIKVELVDLTGDTRRFIAVRLRQRGGGVRDVLMLYAARNGKLEELHAIEIGKEAGGKKLSSTWVVESAKPWKQAKGARRVLVVRAQPAVGWDEDSFHEAPSPDADAIHVPWDDDRNGGVYWLTKDGTLASADLKR